MTYDKKIMFQQKISVANNVGAENDTWIDYFSSYANINNLYGREFWAAAQLDAERTVIFNVRYCKELENLNAVNYRIVYNNQFYNIVFVDNVKYKNQNYKIKALVYDYEQ